MPNEFSRNERVAQLVTRSLSEILRTRVADPRVQSLVITEVEVTRDLRHAKVFVSAFDEDKDKVEDMMQALDNANGYIRRCLAKEVNLRHCPLLHFVFDDTLSKGAKMDALIAKALGK